MAAGHFCHLFDHNGGIFHDFNLGSHQHSRIWLVCWNEHFLPLLAYRPGDATNYCHMGAQLLAPPMLRLPQRLPVLWRSEGEDTC